ncbi:MAG TPA: acylphosphatase [Hanamia sp.]
METFRLLISGKVQGVFFRETSRKIAEKLNITGWVKNTSDGEVEALITGEEKDLKEFVNFCKTGPQRAMVDKVKISKEEKIITFKRFDVLRG